MANLKLAAMGYAIAFVVIALLMLVFGSFIAGELWSPFANGARRALLVWLALPGIPMAALKL